MTRPQTISDEQILQAAREVFLEHGPSVATAQVARRAGISEGTIFRRFGTKHALFSAAMGVKHKEDWSHGLQQLAGQGSVRANLIQVVLKMIDFLRDLVPRVMVMHSGSGKPPPRNFFDGPNSPMRRNFIRLTAYLRAEIQRGRVRRTDPEIIARVLGASCWNYAFHEAIGAQMFEPTDAGTFAEKLVGMLWEGLEPEPLQPEEQS